MRTRTIHVANPSEKSWTRHNYLLWFGACGATYVLVYANGLEDALETAAEYCVEQEWYGLVTPHDQADDDDWAEWERVCNGESDGVTYTEAGFIVSWEWGIVGEDISKADLIAFHRGE